jgi:Ca2+-binding RTX toxin-like protein
MKTPLLLLLVFLGGTIVPPSASAGTISAGGGTFAFTAAGDEGHHITLRTATDCHGLAAPCLRFSDITWSTNVVPPACVDAGFEGVFCPLPGSVSLTLGDQVDFVDDWDGPSVIHGGPGADMIRGRGGDDVLYGDYGDDDVVGGTGNDRVDGGPGNDMLESYFIEADGSALPSDSAGTDVLVGGAGKDVASYEFRVDPLVLSKNGKADDGAPGERDDIGGDVEAIRGGVEGDAIVGGPGIDLLFGMAGDDIITGAGGGDEVDGNEGDDTVLGGVGDDQVSGGGNDDLIVGGPGGDVLYGEYQYGCGAVRSCTDGDDEIRADDGEYDWTECGLGEDTITVDVLAELSPIADCEHVSATGAQSCAQVPRAVRPTCRIVMRALTSCDKTRGAAKKRCLKRAVKRATRTCRKRLNGRRRASCVRSVRGILK